MALNLGWSAHLACVRLFSGSSQTKVRQRHQFSKTASKLTLPADLTFGYGLTLVRGVNHGD